MFLRSPTVQKETKYWNTPRLTSYRLHSAYACVEQVQNYKQNIQFVLSATLWNANFKRSRGLRTSADQRNQGVDPEEQSLIFPGELWEAFPAGAFEKSCSGDRGALQYSAARGCCGAPARPGGFYKGTTVRRTRLEAYPTAAERVEWVEGAFKISFWTSLNLPPSRHGSEQRFPWFPSSSNRHSRRPRCGSWGEGERIGERINYDRGGGGGGFLSPLSPPLHRRFSSGPCFPSAPRSTPGSPRIRVTEQVRAR